MQLRIQEASKISAQSLAERPFTATESYKVLREAEENQEKTCSKKNKLSKDTDSILQRLSTRKIPAFKLELVHWLPPVNLPSQEKR